METIKRTLALLLIGLLVAPDASAFCGFYVAKADASLFNEKSQVILVRDGERTTVTMSNDFKGDVKDFAMVVPVPEVLQRHSIRTVDPSLFSKLDDYSAPRMVEYYDDNPCARYELEESISLDDIMSTSVFRKSFSAADKATELGVTIEATYEVDEYDVLILSAKESTGLKTWLTKEGYKIPETAAEVLDPYIKNGLKFFVVKVDLDRMARKGGQYLSPLQITYSSDRFMLPIRLGMANADGAQDMIVYAFTKTGRIECTNYRTVELPADRDIPLFVKTKGQFGEFYHDVFERSYHQQGENAVFLEYAWEVTPTFGGMKCDPCVGPPPMHQEFANAGVDWIGINGVTAGEPVYFTRLHVRYTRDEFPQDLQFQVTPDTRQYQARYVVRHPAGGDLSCEAGQRYLKDLEWRRKREVDELAALTGWEEARYQGYVYEFSARIQDDGRSNERHNGFPIALPSPTDWPGSGMLMLLLMGLGAAAVMRYKKRQRLV